MHLLGGLAALCIPGLLCACQETLVLEPWTSSARILGPWVLSDSSYDHDFIVAANCKALPLLTDSKRLCRSMPHCCISLSITWNSIHLLIFPECQGCSRCRCHTSSPKHLPHAFRLVGVSQHADQAQVPKRRPQHLEELLILRAPCLAEGITSSGLGRSTLAAVFSKQLQCLRFTTS